VPIWDRLAELGWKRQESARDITLCYYFDIPAAMQPTIPSASLATPGASHKAGNASAEAIRRLTQRGLVPGQHLFASKLAVKQYVARYVPTRMDSLYV
jgi:hypothetical protein